MKKILLAGESWTSVTTHIKGFDIFTTSRYERLKMVDMKWIFALIIMRENIFLTQ